MERVWGWNHFCSRSRFAPDDQIVPTKIQLLERHWHQRQISLVHLGSAGQGVNKTRNDLVPPNRFGNLLRRVNMGEDVGLRIHLAQRLDYLFAAAHTYQPVVNDCDFHQTPQYPSSSRFMLPHHCSFPHACIRRHQISQNQRAQWVGFWTRLPALGYSLPAFELLPCLPLLGLDPRYSIFRHPRPWFEASKIDGPRQKRKTSVLRCLTLTYSFQTQ